MRWRTLCFALLQVLMISVISVAACRADEKIIPLSNHSDQELWYYRSEALAYRIPPRSKVNIPVDCVHAGNGPGHAASGALATVTLGTLGTIKKEDPKVGPKIGSLSIWVTEGAGSTWLAWEGISQIEGVEPKAAEVAAVAGSIPKALALELAQRKKEQESKFPGQPLDWTVRNLAATKGSPVHAAGLMCAMQEGKLLLADGLGALYREIGPGTFTPGTQNRVGPKATAQLTRSYFLAVTEVCRGEWHFGLEIESPIKRPGEWPMSPVSWNECAAWIANMKVRSGMEYRFPTEAEWEFACQAGVLGPYGNDEAIPTTFAVFGRYRGDPAPVASLNPNRFGFYDMHGNVKEWCSDWWNGFVYVSGVDPQGVATGTLRVIRGGSYASPIHWCTSGLRDSCDPTIQAQGWGMGLRPVISIPKPEEPKDQKKEKEGKKEERGSGS